MTPAAIGTASAAPSHLRRNGGDKSCLAGQPRRDEPRRPDRRLALGGRDRIVDARDRGGDRQRADRLAVSAEDRRAYAVHAVLVGSRA